MNKSSRRTTKNGLFQYDEEDRTRDYPEVLFRDLTEAESQNLVERASEIHFILDRYIPGQSEKGISPRVLDELFRHWLADSRADKPAAEDIVMALGSAFAYYIKSTRHMIWQVAKARNEEPTLAVINSDFGITMYPLISVQRRIQSGGAGFFESIIQVLDEKINEMRH